MKRIIGLAVGCVLGGCETAPDNRQQSMLMVQNPMVQEKIFRQDTAPLPWVHVLPSERAAHFLDADFDYLARRIRHAMTINPAKFVDVRLVLVDYAILEPKLLRTKPMKKKYKGQKYCQEYISKPERYFMRLSFYRHNQQPPAPPLFVGAAVLSVRHAAPFEAMHFLVDDIIDERLKLPYNQVEVNLDAAEDIEKNLQELATTTTKSSKVSSKHETSESPQKTHSSTKKTSTTTATSSSTAAPTTSPAATSSSTTAAPAPGAATTTPTTPAVPAPGTAATTPTIPAETSSSSTATPGAATTTPTTPAETSSSSTATPGAATTAPTTPAETSSSSTTPPVTATTTSSTTPSSSPGTSTTSSAASSSSQGASTAAPTTTPSTTTPSS